MQLQVNVHDFAYPVPSAIEIVRAENCGGDSIARRQSSLPPATLHHSDYRQGKRGIKVWHKKYWFEVGYLFSYSKCH
jgi:hypothetical protein